MKKFEDLDFIKLDDGFMKGVQCRMMFENGFGVILRTSSPYPQSYVVSLTRKKSVYCRIVQYFYNL